MKKILIAVTLFTVSVNIFAQDKSDDGFKKQNLFTGGGVTLAYGTNEDYYGDVITQFGAGVSPMIGYSLTKWLDAGVVANFSYYATRYPDDSHEHDFVYGPGVFAKIYPVNFLFVQTQFEENFVNVKYYNAINQNFNTSVPSLLLGGGYCTGRWPGSGNPFFYISIMADVLSKPNSPYVEDVPNGGGGYSTVVLPVIKAGIQIPLFQEHHERTTRPMRRRYDY